MVYISLVRNGLQVPEHLHFLSFLFQLFVAWSALRVQRELKPEWVHSTIVARISSWQQHSQNYLRRTSSLLVLFHFRSFLQCNKTEPWLWMQRWQWLQHYKSLIVWKSNDIWGGKRTVQNQKQSGQQAKMIRLCKKIIKTNVINSLMLFSIYLLILLFCFVFEIALQLFFFSSSSSFSFTNYTHL